MNLTGYDKRTIEAAREPAALTLSSASEVRELTGDTGTAMAYAVVLGRAQFHLRDLTGITGRISEAS